MTSVFGIVYHDMFLDVVPWFHIIRMKEEGANHYLKSNSMPWNEHMKIYLFYKKYRFFDTRIIENLLLCEAIGKYYSCNFLFKFIHSFARNRLKPIVKNSIIRNQMKDD